ncbi:MAG: hypothetical protein PHN31_04600 [Candidatus Gracilibacteria bacterium]|nr:hypothetical protein [Candidatus Gracilibacteria bacterium]
MLIEKIKKMIEESKRNKIEEQQKYNEMINSINDEIVKKASFFPLKLGGADGKIHSLIIDTYGNYIIKGDKWFPILFICISSLPIVVITIYIIYNYNNLILSNYNNLILSNLKTYIVLIPIFLIIFNFVFIIIFYNIFRSKIFDFQNGYFYDLRYQNKIYSLINDEKYKNKIIPINQIHAIQIIKEKVKAKNGSYYSYEFNLILKDSSRINVMDHGNIVKIRSDADQIANRLGLKVWDFTLTEQ